MVIDSEIRVCICLSKQGGSSAAAPKEPPCSHAPPVPVWVLMESSAVESDAEKKRSVHAHTREAWSDVDLARWAAVNRGNACPSPVQVVPVVLAHRPFQPMPRPSPGEASLPSVSSMLPPLPTASTGTRRRLEVNLECAEEVVEALAAKKFQVLEDKDAVSHRVAGGVTSSCVPIAVGELTLKGFSHTLTFTASINPLDKPSLFLLMSLDQYSWGFKVSPGFYCKPKSLGARGEGEVAARSDH